MRVRVLKPLSGISGGVSLSRFVPGVIYEVNASVGAQLVSMGAEIIWSTAPAVVIPSPDKPNLTAEQLTGGVTVVQPVERAADRSRRKRNPRKPT